MSGTITALLVITAVLGILKGVSDSRQMRQSRPNHRWNEAAELYRDWWVR